MHSSRSLPEIKQMRKKFGLSQTQLARLASVSQSLVAKIETGRIDPTFTKAQAIFSALDSLRDEKEKKAADVMSRRIISILPSESIKDAITKMRRHQISQLPVIADNVVVGMVSESVLLEALLSSTHTTCVADTMDDAPPVISEDTSVRLVSSMLAHIPFVLVAKKGELKGVITKADILAQLA